MGVARDRAGLSCSMCIPTPVAAGGSEVTRIRDAKPNLGRCV